MPVLGSSLICRLSPLDVWSDWVEAEFGFLIGDMDGVFLVTPPPKLD